MGKAGKSLKSALQAQQSRLEKKKKALQAAQAAEQRQKQQRQGKGKGKARGADAAKHAKRQIIPFHATDKVLLVGEGDFSFTRALVRLWKDEAAGGNGGSSASALMPPTNITATAYDSEEDCYAKYPGAKAIVDEVTNSGVRVLFGVDATKLEKVNALNGQKWDKIVWNFPHAGEFTRKRHDMNILICIKGRVLQTRIGISSRTSYLFLHFCGQPQVSLLRDPSLQYLSPERKRKVMTKTKTRTMMPYYRNRKAKTSLRRILSRRQGEAYSLRCGTYHPTHYGMYEGVTGLSCIDKTTTGTCRD